MALKPDAGGATRRFAWPQYPLRNLSMSSTFQLAFDKQAGESFNYAPHGTHESTPGAFVVKPQYQVYVPTDRDLDILRKRFPSEDAEHPSWATIEATLIVGGRARDELIWLNASTLIGLLDSAAPSAAKWCTLPPASRGSTCGKQGDFMDEQPGATESNPSAIAQEFRNLADRLTEWAHRATKPGHLGRHICDYGISAGRLLIRAIDCGLFPKENREQNRGWWDRSIARFPGSVVALYGEIPQWALTGGTMAGTPLGNFKLIHDADPHAEQRIRADAVKPFGPEQCARCWSFAVGSWLVGKFPERFRHNAASWDWWHAATDEYGRLLGKNGKPLKGRWYRNGELMPHAFVPQFSRPPGEPMTEAEQLELLNKLAAEGKLHEPDPSDEHYEWKYDGEIAGTTDFYDEADMLEHQRIRADVHATACLLLSKLIDPDGNGGLTQPAGNAKVANTIEPKVALFKPMYPSDLADAIGCSGDALQRYAKAVDASRPGRGKRNFRYTGDDVQKILLHVSEHAGESTIRNKARAMLAQGEKNP